MYFCFVSYTSTIEFEQKKKNAEETTKQIKKEEAQSTKRSDSARWNGFLKAMKMAKRSIFCFKEMAMEHLTKTELFVFSFSTFHADVKENGKWHSLMSSQKSRIINTIFLVGFSKALRESSRFVFFFSCHVQFWIFVGSLQLIQDRKRSHWINYVVFIVFKYFHGASHISRFQQSEERDCVCVCVCAHRQMLK